MGGQFAQRFELYAEAEPWFSLLGMPISEPFVWDGFLFGGSLLLFLTVHEFGHYFAARYHRINTSLPYYIPTPFIAVGTLGAVISIREPIPSTRKLFDVGVAGPIAGFVVALGVLLYAFTTLPPPEYLLDLAGHEAMKEYIREHGTFPDTMLAPEEGEDAQVLVVGNTILYWGLSQFFTNVPPLYEIYHYPMLFAGWLGLFFTALNLLPVGQLDGGHTLYALFGYEWHKRLARGFVILLLVSGGIGYVDDISPLAFEYATWAGYASWVGLGGILYFFLTRTFGEDRHLILPTLVGLCAVVALGGAIDPIPEWIGYTGWLFWTLLIVLLIGIEHPPVVDPEPLTPTRRWLGYLSIVIFILCFSIRPIYIA